MPRRHPLKTAAVFLQFNVEPSKAVSNFGLRPSNAHILSCAFCEQVRERGLTRLPVLFYFSK